VGNGILSNVEGAGTAEAENQDHTLNSNSQNTERKHDMKEIRKRTRIVVLVAGLIAIGAMPALAQDKPADNMQIVLEKARADKKLFVATNMELNETEAKAFWPVYEKYQDELFLLRSRTAKLIKDYAKSFNDMTDQEAKVLLDEVMTIESLGLELRKAYLPQFRQVLPEKRVARYFQIENKIQAALYYELAKEIPLVQ
jgi:hypothetical protein